MLMPACGLHVNMRRINGKENGFTQPLLVGLEAEQPQEIELDNCLILSRPEYKDTGKKQEWSCSLHAQPSAIAPKVIGNVVE